MSNYIIKTHLYAVLIAEEVGVEVGEEWNTLKVLEEVYKTLDSTAPSITLPEDGGMKGDYFSTKRGDAIRYDEHSRQWKYLNGFLTSSQVQHFIDTGDIIYGHKNPRLIASQKERLDTARDEVLESETVAIPRALVERLRVSLNKDDGRDDMAIAMSAAAVIDSAGGRL